MAYVAVANSTMILFLFLSRLKEKGYISFEIDKYFIPILVSGFIFLLIVGWLEIKILGGWQKEASINFSRNPPFSNMKYKIDKIYEHLNLDEVDLDETDLPTLPTLK